VHDLVPAAVGLSSTFSPVFRSLGPPCKLLWGVEATRVGYNSQRVQQGSKNTTTSIPTFHRRREDKSK
jgi:hypothetical protein